ncbi:unnamed protein product [Paramecium primaurelia]|uniref:MORN repeat protein n=1 Tax=Paramecium primaurelia TaxID=5886 RepID=A0A8S1Q5H8_PARPR|nr:unnamed protein product [Paramecium primaurelia]
MKVVQFNNGLYYGQLDYFYKKIGLGVYVYDDSTLYFGQWKNDLYNGEGLIIFPYGAILKATFKNNSIEGIGIFITNTEVLIGEYQNSVLMNKALLFNGKQWKLRSFFKNGQYEDVDCQPSKEQKLFSEFIKQYPSLYKSKLLLSLVGFMIHENQMYIGEFKNNKLDGLGRILDFDKRILEDGYYKNGLLQKGFRYYVENNTFEQVQLVFEQGSFEYKIIMKGNDFPNELIQKSRALMHLTSKQYISKSQEIHYFHNRYQKCNHQIKPLLKITLNQFIIDEDVSNEGETNKPIEHVRKASFHNEKNKQLDEQTTTRTISFHEKSRQFELDMYKIDFENALRPMPINVKQPQRKRIFDKYNF